MFYVLQTTEEEEERQTSAAGNICGKRELGKLNILSVNISN